jgi:hypothetical protein
MAVGKHLFPEVVRVLSLWLSSVHLHFTGERKEWK